MSLNACMHSHPISNECEARCSTIKAKKTYIFVDNVLIDGNGESKLANGKTMTNQKRKIEANSKDI